MTTTTTIILMVMMMMMMMMMMMEISKVIKRTLFNKTRQYNINIFDKIIFSKYTTRKIKATEMKC